MFKSLHWRRGRAGSPQPSGAPRKTSAHVRKLASAAVFSDRRGLGADVGQHGVGVAFDGHVAQGDHPDGPAVVDHRDAGDGVLAHDPHRRIGVVGHSNYAILGETVARLQAFAGREAVESKTREVLDAAAGLEGHVFNLGHGVLPTTDPDALTRLVEYVHTQTTR